MRATDTRIVCRHHGCTIPRQGALQARVRRVSVPRVGALLRRPSATARVQEGPYCPHLLLVDPNVGITSPTSSSLCIFSSISKNFDISLKVVKVVLLALILEKTNKKSTTTSPTSPTSPSPPETTHKQVKRVQRWR